MNLAAETSAIRWERLLTFLTLLMPAFSLPCPPHVLPDVLRRTGNAPLPQPHPKKGMGPVRSFGSEAWGRPRDTKANRVDPHFQEKPAEGCRERPYRKPTQVGGCESTKVDG